MIALCSDAYFSDLQCVGDWNIFARRMSMFGGDVEHRSEGFIPLLWRPPSKAFPRDAAQYLDPAATAFGEAYTRLGLHQLLSEGMRRDYYQVVRGVAARIAAAQHHRLPPTVSAPVTPVAPSAPVPATALSAPGSRRIVLSFVGSDQEWADWITSEARGAGHDVAHVRWHPTRGERLADTVNEIRRRNPDVVVVLLSRRYRPPDLCGADFSSSEDWNLLDDGGAFGGKLLRVVVDNEPLPEPLRSSGHFDVSELERGAVDRLFAAAGIAHSARSGSEVPVPESRRPGTLPEIWNTPDKNDFFVGRDVELEQIHQLLCNREQAVVVTTEGVTGLGATEVAVEYSHRYKLGYNVVWWVSYPDDVQGQLGVLRDRLAAVAAKDSAKGSSTGPRDRLVVLAGASEPAELADVASGLKARVLIVACRVDQAWADRVVEIGPLRPAESVLLLREAAPVVDPDTAADIVAALGHRPRQVVNVARFLLRGAVTPRACADLLSVVAYPWGTAPGQAGLAEAEAEAPGEVPPVAGSDNAAATNAAVAVAGSHPSGVTDRDVTNLLGELNRVACVNDRDRFEDWVSALENILGRPVDLPPSAVLASKLLAVVDQAVAQPGPGMLDAVARAMETIDSTDRQVVRFRRLVDQLGERWGATSSLSAGGVQLSVELPQRAPVATAGGLPQYRFFTSYARSRDNTYVRRFHQALQDELELRLPRDDVGTGFFDQLSLQGGVHWRVELRNAARQAPVLLALRCDDYFRSDWCGREFAVFAERVRRAPSPAGVPAAAVLLLNWLPVTVTVPDCVQQLQETNLNLGNGLDDRPLLDLMRDSRKAFRRYVTELAKRIIAVTADPLPPLDEASADGVTPAFGMPR
jgi:hypothetical protein